MMGLMKMMMILAKIFLFSMVMPTYRHQAFWVGERVLSVPLASSPLHLVPLGPRGHSTLAYNDVNIQTLALSHRSISR